jgi:hypothetical protein
MMRTKRPLLTSSLLLVLAAAAPAGADWLVTRAGGRIETRGPWQVKGKLVVFTGANGTLGSLRLADLDLAASENATAEAKEAKDKVDNPEPAKPQERKKSVRSLTDADFSRKPGADAGAKPPDGAGAGAPKEKEEDAKAPAQDGKSPVAVASWSKADRTEGDGIDLFGTLQNNGKDMATDITLKVQLVNEANDSVGTAEGVLAATSIPAGGSTSFRVPFAGVFAFASATFDVTSKSLVINPPDPKLDPKKKAPPAADHQKP